MKERVIGLFISMVVVGLVAGCDHDGDSDMLYPHFQDDNRNAINDHVEKATHFVSTDDPRWHEFIDSDGDDVCDLALQADPVWHGPGYIDTDGDDICDYWDTDSPMHQEGRRDIVHGFDFDEVEHMGPGHH